MTTIPKQFSESPYKVLMEKANLRTQELENLDKSHNDSQQAMLNVMEDLEETKKLMELEKAKDEAMLASIGEGMIAVDNLGKVILMNNVAEEILGFSLKELKGKLITNLVLEDETGDQIPLSKRPTTMALVMAKTVKVIYYFVRKDKTRFPIAITATPIKLGTKVIGLIEIIRDITRELEIDKAKSEFVSLSSHQLRTPLGIMKWYMEALGEEKCFREAPAKIHEYIDHIYRNNERVLALVRDLLSVSRIDQGSVKDAPELVDLVMIVKDTVKQMRILAKKEKVKLYLEIIKDRPLVTEIDALRFYEVIENLISNAIEYTEEGGKVVVKVKSEKGSIVISVHDTGIGISSIDLKKLFTKFFRAENAVTKNAEGSGLGLYVVKSYVEGWGGIITVKSSISKGSIFTITLPIKKDLPAGRQGEKI